MLVNKPRKVKFSNPHHSYWEGGRISLFNDCFAKCVVFVNNSKGRIDMAGLVYPDKSYNILTKRNIDGLRR